MRFGPWIFLGVAVVMAAIAVREWWPDLGGASIVLAFGVLAIREGRRRQRKILRIGGWLIALASFAVGSMGLYLYLPFGRISRSEWPVALVRMAEALHAEAGDIYAKCNGFPVFDRSYTWSIPIEDGSPDVAFPMDVGPIDAHDVPPWFPELFPIWWRPDMHGDETFFSTPDFPFNVRGKDGDHLLAMYDRTAGRLYVWLKVNW